MRDRRDSAYLRALSFLVLLFLSGCATPAPRTPPSDRNAPPPGALVAAVVKTLERHIPDLPIPREERAAFRARARAAKSFAEERAIAVELLDRIPASHIALYSSYAVRFFEAELAGRDSPTIGFFLVGIGGELFVSDVLAGSPAAAAGIVRGDRLIAMDGVPAAASPRLDDRHDDLAVPDEESRLVRVVAGERVAVTLHRGGGPPAEIAVEIPIVPWSSLRSDRIGARTIERDGVRVGVLPISYIYARETSRLLLDALAGPLRGAEALVLDVRGRGGSAIALAVVIAMLRNPAVTGDSPLVLAMDRRTRSAKEVLARELARDGRAVLVGERTAGAVRPAWFVPLVRETWLLCPRGPVGRDGYGLEGKGVDPDLSIADPFPAAGGADPILEAAIAEAVRLAREGRPR